MDISFRDARKEDVYQLVKMLADDTLGSQRENLARPLEQSYLDAFDTIERDPNHRIVVLEIATEIAGMMQVSYLPNLTYRGGWRAQIEGVRVAQQWRGKGMGRLLIDKAIELAREKGCRMIQLTTDKNRPRGYCDLPASGLRGLAHRDEAEVVMERPGLIEPAMNERDTIFDKSLAILQAQDPTPVIYYLSDQVVSVKQDVLIEMVCFVAGFDSNSVQVECNIILNGIIKAF